MAEPSIETAEGRAAARALCETVAPPPWDAEVGTHACCVVDQERRQVAAALGLDMAKFIAAARSLLPAALDRIATLEAQLAEARAAALEEAAQVAQGWQPIETAPTDGAVVDLWYAGRWANCHFRDGRWVQTYRWTEGPKGRWARRSYVVSAPTHWMPLPEPPSQDSGFEANIIAAAIRALREPGA